MLSLYSLPETWWHRRRAGSKLLALCVLCVLLWWWPVFLWLLLPLSWAALCSLGPQGRNTLRWLLRLWPWWLAVVLWQTWVGQWELGLTVVARWATLLACASVLTLSTRLDALMAVVQRILPGVSGRRFAIALALVVRSVPQLLDGYRARELAWRARSLRPARHQLIAPWLVDTLRDSDHVSLALQARGGSRGLPALPSSTIGDN